jgi:hypothetical protein
MDCQPVPGTIVARVIEYDLSCMVDIGCSVVKLSELWFNCLELDQYRDASIIRYSYETVYSKEVRSILCNGSWFALWRPL